MGAVPGVGTRRVAKRLSQCETIEFCESSASELMLRLLKQKFTIKKMERILYKNFSRHTTKGKKKGNKLYKLLLGRKSFFC